MIRLVFASIIFLSFSTLRAQEPVLVDPNAFSSVGAARYIQPEEPHYRALFGFGGNEGVGAATPRSYIGNISYELAPSQFTAGFMMSNSASRQPPRITYTEFDAMYGIALDGFVRHYQDPSESFHAAISAGIGVNDYQTRWHFGRPYFPDSTRNSSAYSPALPIQLQAVYEPLRYVGIGAILFYTVSKLEPMYGGAVGIEVRY